MPTYEEATCTCGCVIEYQVEQYYEDVVRFNQRVITRCDEHADSEVKHVEVYGYENAVIDWTDVTQSTTED